MTIWTDENIILVWRKAEKGQIWLFSKIGIDLEKEREGFNALSIVNKEIMFHCLWWMNFNEEPNKYFFKSTEMILF